MNRWTRITLVGLMALTGPACTPEQIGQVFSAIQPAQLVGKGSVSGKVVDPTTQKAIANAQVTVGTQRITSDAAGGYGAQGLAAGTLFLHVEADGYQPFFGEVQVAEGTTRFDVPLKPLVSRSSPSPQPSGSAAPSASDSLPSPTPSLASPSAAPGSDAVPSPPLTSPSANAASDAVPNPNIGSDVVASPSPSVDI